MIEHPAGGNSFWVMHCIYYEPASVQKKCRLKLQEWREAWWPDTSKTGAFVTNKAVHHNMDNFMEVERIYLTFIYNEVEAT